VDPDGLLAPMTTPEAADPFGAPAATISEPPKKKRKKWKWITGSLVVVLAILVVVGLVFGRKGSDTPHDAVNKFWTALTKHDIKKAQTYACSQKDLSSDKDFKAGVDALASFSIGAESGSGGKRTYPVTIHSNDGSAGIITTTATKSAGEWYVCDLGAVQPVP
jgi:hypothetical protein